MSKWYSIEDKTPKENEYVITYSKGYGVYPAWYYSSRYNDLDRCSDDIQGVTHWQRIPNKPKGL